MKKNSKMSARPWTNNYFEEYYTNFYSILKIKRVTTSDYVENDVNTFG